ncbi:MAG: hypothetical protein ACERKD_08925 [Prolixibacteraceae bacterium]
MTLQEAYNLFERLKNETTIKAEIKIYEKFLYIITELKKREFSKDEIQSIEAELDNLNLESNHENGKKYFKKAQDKFEKYLKNTFSLTSKRYYTNLYGGIGLSFGLLFGVIFLSGWERSLGIAMGLVFGMLIGSIIGQWMDTKAANEGRAY